MVKDMLDKNEIKFWLSIIGIIASIILSSNTILVKLAVLEDNVSDLKTSIAQVDKNTISIAKIKTLLKLD